MTVSLRRSIRKWKVTRRLSRRWKVQKTQQAAAFQRKKFARKARNLWMEGHVVDLGYNVYMRELQLALAFRSFLSAFASQRRQWSTLSTTGYLSKSVSVLPLTNRPVLFSLHLHRLYRAPRGRALIYLKDEVDAKLPASSLPARVARFSYPGSRFNFYFRFLVPVGTCGNLFF